MSSLLAWILQLADRSRKTLHDILLVKIGNCTVTRGKSSKLATGSVVRFFRCL